MKSHERYARRADHRLQSQLRGWTDESNPIRRRGIRSRRARFRLARERRRDLTHEAVHLLFDLVVRLKTDVEIKDHFGESGRLDLLQCFGHRLWSTNQYRVLGQV